MAVENTAEASTTAEDMGPSNMIAMAGSMGLSWFLGQPSLIIPLFLGIIASALSETDDNWEGRVRALLVTLIWMCLFVGYVYTLRQRMRQRRFALQAHQETLRGMMRQLEDLAATDELTGLYNRRHFIRRAEAELSRLRAGHRSGLALIDLDYFKRIIIQAEVFTVAHRSISIQPSKLQRNCTCTFRHRI